MIIVIITLIIIDREEYELLVMQQAGVELRIVAEHFNLRARAFNHYYILHPGSTKESLDLDIFLVYTSLFVLSEQIGFPGKF